MNKEILERQLLNYINPAKQQELHYFLNYQLEKIKRFLKRNATIFLFQYLMILYIDLSQPALPLYPPLGIAFTAFFLMGSDIFLGLFLAGFCGYLLHNPVTAITVCNFLADLLAGYWGARVCQKVLSCDIKPFENQQEALNFLKTNAFFSCILSSVLRILGLVLTGFQFNTQLLFLSLDSWLADLNAILVYPLFMLTWVSLFHTREPVRASPMILFMICSIVCFFLCYQFLMIYPLYYYLGFSIVMVCIGSLAFKLVNMSAIVFILSHIYFIIFSYQKSDFMQNFGLKAYTFVPLCLLFCILFIMCNFNRSLKRTQKYLHS